MSAISRRTGSWGASLLVLALFGAPALAQTAQTPPGAAGVPNALQGFSQNRDQPVQIEAASLEMRDKSGVATFSGNVKVVQGDTTMRCKTLVVFYQEGGGMKTTTPGPAGQQQISRLEARGGVTVVQKDQTATGDSGLFDLKANTVTLIGNVIVSQGKNVMKGERLVVDITSGAARVESGKQTPVRMIIEQTQQQPTPGKPGEKPAAQPKPGLPQPFSRN